MSRLTSAVYHTDELLLLALVSRRRPALDLAMKALTRLGNAEVIIPLVVTLALSGADAVAWAGVLAFWSLVVSHLVVQLIKRGVCRERPRLPVGFAFLIVPEDRFSLPSGHATAGLAVALPLALALGGPVGALVLALGLTVGVSRCYLGVHYPSDVLAGWSLAALSVGVVGLIA